MKAQRIMIVFASSIALLGCGESEQARQKREVEHAREMAQIEVEKARDLARIQSEAQKLDDTEPLASSANPVGPRGSFYILQADGKLAPFGSMWFGDDGAGQWVALGGLFKSPLTWKMAGNTVTVNYKDGDGKEIQSHFTFEAPAKLVDPDGTVWGRHNE